jgi:putative transposase
MAKKRYSTDLTDGQWQLIEKYVPPPKPGGRPTEYSKREIVNGILYLNRTGCPWRLLPKDLPPYGIVNHYFRLWTQAGRWEQINTALREAVRKKAGRKPTPTAAILDSQSVKTADQSGPSGYDAGKKIKGRKRHLMVDTLGLVLGVVVTSAAVQDRDGAVRLLADRFLDFWRLIVIWADAAYSGLFVDWVKGLRPHGRLHVEIVSKLADQKGFQVHRKRWIVERTFAWLYKWRRLRCDYEQQVRYSQALIQVAAIGIMLNRLTRA